LSILDLLRNHLELLGWPAVPPALALLKTPLYLMD